MTELIVATKNQGKLREIKELLSGSDFKVTSLSDYPDAPRIEESGKTFAQNAIIKAVTVAMYTKKLTLGEDSGLQVKALKNKPGIYSARFAGDNSSDEENNSKLLKDLKRTPFKKRQARYRCFMALSDGEKIVDVLSGSCSGLIALKEKGTNGFGYDPLFYIPRYQKTFGELDPKIKAKISHRARALLKLTKVLKIYSKKNR
ncbi:MAG: XTP/dITP diphosphatase [Candidatus Omnitrophica bacterium]|nr:XTP/dITP diphosphatase [Candidatus Omnitrophota bacterium]